jgi:hypothetical protein
MPSFSMRSAASIGSFVVDRSASSRVTVKAKRSLVGQAVSRIMLSVAKRAGERNEQRGNSERPLGGRL